jgi:hypothetical protein
VALTSCGASADTTSPAEATASSPQPQPNATAIRDADLSTAQWTDTPRDSTVTLAGDEPVGDLMDGGQYTIGEMPIVYADVDGDGFEDALAALRRVEGNGLSEIWYVWRWDEEAQRPVQVLDPVAESVRCGAEVSAVAADESTFVITERRRDLADIGTCDATPPNEVTRTIALEDGVPVQRDGYGGYGGACPQPQNGDADAYLIGDTELFSAPDTAATPVSGPDIYSYYGLPLDPYPYLQRDGWVLVGFGPDADSATFDDYGSYVPCAWAETRR